jgi:adenosylcobinamide-phosphate synthase
MMFQWYSADAAAVHPLLVVMLALAIDVALGDPPKVYARIPHPVAVFGGLIAFFDKKLNREQRSDRARFWRGALATVFLVALAGFGCWRR